MEILSHSTLLSSFWFELLHKLDNTPLSGGHFKRTKKATGNLTSQQATTRELALGLRPFVKARTPTLMRKPNCLEKLGMVL